MIMKQNSGGVSCFVVGCLGVIGMIGVLVLGLVIGIPYILGQFVERYTDDEPMVFEEVTITREDFAEIEERITTFTEALDQGLDTEPLVLSGEEINAALVYQDDLEEYRDYFRITIEDGLVAGALSFPFSEIPELVDTFSGLDGRYLNGKGVFEVHMRDGILYVHAESFEVKGEPIPEQYMSGIRSENLFGEIQQDPDAQDMLGMIESIEVEGNKIRIVPKPADERPEPREVDEQTFDEEPLEEEELEI